MRRAGPGIFEAATRMRTAVRHGRTENVVYKSVVCKSDLYSQAGMIDLTERMSPQAESR